MGIAYRIGFHPRAYGLLVCSSEAFPWSLATIRTHHHHHHLRRSASAQGRQNLSSRSDGLSGVARELRVREGLAELLLERFYTSMWVAEGS